MDTSARIAAAAADLLYERGLAETTVDDLRDAAGVSLRTLYRHARDREGVIALALQHRHRAYMDWLDCDAPPGPGPGPVLHVIDRLEDWDPGASPRGCLFLRALAANPDSHVIAELVHRHKHATRALIAERVRAATGDAPDDLVDAVFGLHEGAVSTAPIIGGRAYDAARTAVRALLDG